VFTGVSAQQCDHGAMRSWSHRLLERHDLKRPTLLH
jgi:hypothetical protein